MQLLWGTLTGRMLRPRGWGMFERVLIRTW
jgi:hypothetical protein